MSSCLCGFETPKAVETVEIRHSRKRKRLRSVEMSESGSDDFQEFCGCQHVRHSAMSVVVHYGKCFRQVLKSPTLNLGDVFSRENKGVLRVIVEDVPFRFGILGEQRKIVAQKVMPHKHRASREFEKIGQNVLESGFIRHHFVGYMGLFHYQIGNFHARIKQRGESFGNFAVDDFCRANLNGFYFCDVQSRGLEIENHEGLVSHEFRGFLDFFV